MRIVLTANSCFAIANFREGLIRVLLARGCEVLILAPNDGYREKLESLGCTVCNIHMDRNGTSPLSEAQLLHQIFSFLKSKRPDLVLGYTVKNNIYAGLACRYLGIPFVPNVTGLGPAFNTLGPLNWTVRTLYSFAFVGAETVFFQNPHDQEAIVTAKLVAADRTRLLPGSGVDLERFSAHPMPAEDNGIVFLLVARLLWDKGVGIFVEAAQALRNYYPHVRFQLLGSPDPVSNSSIPETKIKAWVREGIIEYLGHSKDVRPALTAAHCIVLPSWYREGTPRVLLEAAATGRPIITTDMPGCQDTVKDSETGFVCAAKDSAALVKAMIQFIDLPKEEKVLMGMAARMRAERKFDEKLVIAEYLRVMERIRDAKHGVVTKFLANH